MTCDLDSERAADPLSTASEPASGAGAVENAGAARALSRRPR
jgi:hypothetical protein